MGFLFDMIFEALTDLLPRWLQWLLLGIVVLSICLLVLSYSLPSLLSGR